jgi:hypothetical protein
MLIYTTITKTNIAQNLVKSLSHNPIASPLNHDLYHYHRMITSCVVVYYSQKSFKLKNMLCHTDVKSFGCKIIDYTNDMSFIEKKLSQIFKIFTFNRGLNKI